MQFKDFKKALEWGQIKKVNISPAPMDTGWQIQILLSDNAKEVIETNRSRQDCFKPRCFKSLDTAAKVLIEAGLSRFQVIGDPRED